LTQVEREYEIQNLRKYFTNILFISKCKVIWSNLNLQIPKSTDFKYDSWSKNFIG